MEPSPAPVGSTMEGAGLPSSAITDDIKSTIESAPNLPTALTPPTSEELNHELKKEQDESDLSELDFDDEDEEEIFPDHYWDGENGGRIPVFKPTMDQFRSFKKFIEKIDKYGMKSGIVKVVPPKEWRDSLPALDEYVKRIKIKNPITQEFNGTFGTYTQQNVEKQRSYNLPEWKELTQATQYQPPAKRGERRRHQEKVVRGGGSLRGRATVAAANAASEDGNSPKPRKKPGRPRRLQVPTEEPASDDESKDQVPDAASDPPTPSSPVEKPAQKPAKRQRGRPSRGGGQAKSVTSRRLNNTAEAADYVDEEAFKDFDYHLEGVEEYTPERCSELETHYWKSLGFNQPMYAADMPGSLFDDSVSSWNVAKLENLLDVLGTKVPGVNTAYLYMGMWKATFAWHLEDVDLYSINYIHFGAPKQWYSISQEDARKFERAMKAMWPMDSKNCDQFLRHKTYLISPDVLQKQYNVKVNKLVHFEGEFVITYPYGYHSGYNLGYNCAESVNFATESWLEYGRIARKCNCESDNVWVDVAEIERKLRGEPTPEYYEETDDDDDLDDMEDGNLPSPPASIKGQKGKSRKRKRDPKQEAPKKKKKIRIRIRAPTREPCVLCPNDNPWELLLPTDTGKKAHRSCALYTPETYIINDNGKEKVYGATNIDKARLDLKCNFCRSRRGACFQCSAKKCTRAFHATCAIAAGVLVDAGPVPTFAEDGTEYFEEGYDFRCRYHRPKMPKSVNVDSLENSKRVQNYAKDLKPNDTVQVQFIGGEAFGGLVVENRPSELSVVVEILPDGDRVEIEWKWLCLLNPNDSLRPKPSANALPMPADRSKSSFSIANRQDGVPTQDEPFHEDPSFRWHDFFNMHTPPPGYASVQLHTAAKLKVDLNTRHQLFYYLGIPSSETKDFFTDKPGSNEIDRQANFIERAAPKPAYKPATVSGSVLLARIKDSIKNVRTEKPYIYKPKDPAKPDSPYSVDQQALANQRNFLAEGIQRPLVPSLAQPQLSNPTYISPYALEEGPEAADDSGPLRAFPPDQYYSSTTLPAAYNGEYSAFRRQSQGAQTMQRPEFGPMGYSPNHHVEPGFQVPYIPDSSSAVPDIRRESGIVDGVAVNAINRPASSAHGRLSPEAPQLSAAITTPSQLKSVDANTDLGYVKNLQKYPHLMNSFCRRPKVYESPYPIGGGFCAKYLPSELQKQHDHSQARRARPTHTPSNSVSSLGDLGRRHSQQWSPPSQVWDRAGLTEQSQTPPPLYQGMQNTTSRPSSSALQHIAQDGPRPVQHLPSTASRDGAQARMLRDQGYLSYSNSAAVYHRTGTGTLDAAKTWNSPQAPTPSPLSGSNTPGHLGMQPPAIQHGTWTTLPRDDPSEDGFLGRGYGPMLPQMGMGSSHDIWRFIKPE